jgi:acyl-CoA reductase-like NAD-dependent aldehyde dehydrogenase
MTIARDLLIGGKAVPGASGRQTEDRSPRTGDVCATIAAAGPQDVVGAVDAAQAAFPAWAATPPSTRRARLMRAADLLESRLTEFTDAMVAETGGTRRWAHGNVKITAEHMRYAATTATVPATDRSGQWSIACRTPAGAGEPRTGTEASLY